VKAVESLHIPLPSHPSTLASEITTTTILCTISSDGKVHIYDLASLPTITQGSSETVKLTPAAVYDTNGTRLTCVTLADGNDDRVTGKRKKVEEEAGTDGEKEQIYRLGHDRSGDGDNESDLA
jgi:protein MAK11